MWARRYTLGAMSTKKTAKARKTADLHHRTITGQVQRARTRAHIIETAIGVFSEQGPFKPLIDDFVKAAGLSRGSFYNYFSTVHELLEEAVNVVADSCIMEIEAAVKDIKSPVIRFSCAAQLFQRQVRSYPVLAAFVAAVSSVSDRLAEKLSRDIHEAMSLGLIKAHSAEAAFIAAHGIAYYSLVHPIQHPERKTVPETEVIRLILNAWGVPPALIKRALAAPLPRLKPLTLKESIPKE